MILLDKKDYHQLLIPLSQVDINHLFARAILEHKMDGCVYVNEINEPSTYYIKHNYGMSLLFGSTDNEVFNKELISYLLNENKKRDKSEYMQVYPQHWNQKLDELLADKIVDQLGKNSESKVVKLGRVNFQFNPKKYHSTTQQKLQAYNLVETDVTMFNIIKGSVIPSRFWRNANEFSQQSVGFTAMANDEPASTAYAAFFHEPYLEIGIETNAQHQGKGLAQWVCSALIDYCLQNNFEPVWACRADNTGSLKLAEKLGFEQIRTIPYYQLPNN